MSTYSAPLLDMEFLLNHSRHHTGWCKRPDLADLDPELIKAVLEEAGKFATGELAALNQSGDREGCHWQDGKVTTPRGWQAAYQQFCEGGWLSLALPERIGGQGLPKLLAMAVNEMWLSANMAFVMFHALSQGGCEILLHAANAVQQARYLPALASGQWSLAMALTEPNAGSDLAPTTTKAFPLGDGLYRIKGQKLFITYGEHDLTENILHLVLARTPDAAPGSRGLSLFLVPKHRINPDGTLGDENDLRCVSIEHKLGLHGSPTCSISYGDQDNCIGELIGNEGQGLSLMFILMNEARLSTGLQGVATGEMAYQRALSYASERAQGNHWQDNKRRVALIEHPDVARMLLSMRSRVVGLRSLAYLISARIDLANHCTDQNEQHTLLANVALLTPIFKAFATEQGHEMSGTAIQIFGGMGYIEETGVAQLMRDSRVTTIYEGTTGIQAKDLLFRKILSDRGMALSQLLDEVKACADRLLSSTALRLPAQQLMACSEQLQQVIDELLTDEKAVQLRCYAGAVPLLDALGYLLTGWQLAELASSPQLAEYETTYQQNMVALAQFYTAHHLAKVPALLQTVATAETGLADFRFNT